MKILVTGSTGFVGRNLVEYLNCNGLTTVPLGRVDWINIGGTALPESLHTVAHLAGKAHDIAKTSNPEEYYQVNFELTKRLYSAFLQSDAKKFIFVSSVKAAADSVDGVLTEDVTPDPKTDYGKSKLMAERYIQSQPLPPGKSYFILRPSMIHGPGNKGNLNLLYKFVKRGIPYPLAGFTNQRSFLSIENLCFIIKELIERDNIVSGIYQVADDEPLSTNQVVTLLADAIGVKPKLWKISPRLIRFFSKCGDILHLPLTTERLHKLTESYVVNNNKIKQVLNKELPLTAVQGLTITAKSFKKV